MAAMDHRLPVKASGGSCLPHEARASPPKISAWASNHLARNPLKFPREIDTTSFEQAIQIVTDRKSFQTHFRDPLKEAYPNGVSEACPRSSSLSSLFGTASISKATEQRS